MLIDVVRVHSWVTVGLICDESTDTSFNKELVVFACVASSPAELELGFAMKSIDFLKAFLESSTPI